MRSLAFILFLPAALLLSSCSPSSITITKVVLRENFSRAYLAKNTASSFSLLVEYTNAGTPKSIQRVIVDLRAYNLRWTVSSSELVSHSAGPLHTLSTPPLPLPAGMKSMPAGQYEVTLWQDAVTEAQAVTTISPPSFDALASPFPALKLGKRRLEVAGKEIQRFLALYHEKSRAFYGPLPQGQTISLGCFIQAKVRHAQGDRAYIITPYQRQGAQTILGPLPEETYECFQTAPQMEKKSEQEGN